jgi:hypothetical protein
MHNRIIIALALTALISACDAAPPTDSQAMAAAPAVNESAPQPESSQPSNAAAQALEGVLKKDMAYADLRRAVLDKGWLPLMDPQCKENVGGVAAICNELMELESCSSDGHCMMRFAENSSQNVLRVATYGDYRKWDAPGREADMTVQSWESSVLKSESAVSSKNGAATSCPSQKFEDFLKAFAQDEKLQAAFTKPLVEVAVLLDLDEEGYKPERMYVRSQDYKDFRLTHRPDGYHFVGGDGVVDSQPVPVEIASEAGNAYLVKVPYGTESVSYRFRSNAGCWYLAEDPEPPSP